MDKCIVINGADGGLGREIMKLHLDAGDRVYGTDIHFSEESVGYLHNYPELALLKCDVTDDEGVERCAKQILKRERRIDILYNVSGIYFASQKVGIEQMDMDKCLKMYNVNALGALRVVRALFGALKEESVVVNISSEAGSIGASRRVDDVGYSMSKAAMNMGAKILSNILWERGARVICFHPGWMLTKMGGEEAKKSSLAVPPRESARDIVGIVTNMEKIPRDWMFMDHRGNLLPW